LWLYFKADQIEGKEKVNEMFDSLAILLKKGKSPSRGEEDLSDSIILSG
jgi:hypothetical protein